MLDNELAWRGEIDVRASVLHIWDVMQECVANGIATEGTLPGGLRVRRRAPELSRKLALDAHSVDPLWGMDWITLHALAVNEENAAGGRVVTAPTNAAAGIIPVVPCGRAWRHAQVESVAEIAIEHNLGLTCDLVGGRGQIPCIERSAVAAVKANTAARAALRATARTSSCSTRSSGRCARPAPT